MKNIIIGLTALFLVLLSFSFALAENDTINASIVSNETPMLISAPINSEINNVSEEEATGNLFWKRFDIWFTFNQEKKAEKELKLAELQLVMARVAERNNNTKAMEMALKAHQNLIDRVKMRISRFDINSTDLTAKLLGLERAIEVYQLRIDRLNVKLNRSNLTTEEVVRIQARIDQAENNTQHLMDVAKEKRDRIEQRAINRSEERSRQRDMNRTRNQTEEEDENESETVLSGSNVSENNNFSSDEMGGVVGCPAGCVCGDRGVILECEQ